MTQTTRAPIESRPTELRAAIGDGTLHRDRGGVERPVRARRGQADSGGAVPRSRPGTGFAFCEAALGWNTDGTVIDTLRLTNWDGGYPDVFAVPDLSTFTRLPWRPGVGHVISDIVTHHRTPSLLDPRAVLRRVLDRLAGLGYTAKIGVEFEFYLLETRRVDRSSTTSRPTRWRTPTRSTR